MRNRHTFGQRRFRIGWVAFFAVVVLTIGSSIAYRDSDEIVSITVRNKERISQGSDKSIQHKYLVWTAEGEVFENTDTLIFGKYNSSDLYGQLEIGKRYQVRVAGWRVPFLSAYRNILEIISSE